MRLLCFSTLILSSLFLISCGPSTKSEPALLSAEFQDGWSALETGGGHEWYWGGERNSIVLINELSETQVVAISYDVLSLNERSLRVYKDGQNLFTEVLDTKAWEGRQYRIEIDPGVSTLVFETDEPSEVPIGETRDLRICIRDFNIVLGEENAEPSVFQVTLQLGDGWYGEELDGTHSWRWVESRGFFNITNETAEEKTVSLRFDARTLDPRVLELSMNGDSLLSEELASSSWKQLRHNVSLAPGENRFVFETPTAGTKMQGDERSLSFCIQDLKVLPAL